MVGHVHRAVWPRALLLSASRPCDGPETGAPPASRPQTIADLTLEQPANVVTSGSRFDHNHPEWVRPGPAPSSAAAPS